MTEELDEVREGTSDQPDNRWQFGDLPPEGSELLAD